MDIENIKKELLNNDYVINDDLLYFKCRITGLGITQRLNERATLMVLRKKAREVGISGDVDSLDLSDLVALLSEKGFNPLSFAIYEPYNRPPDLFLDLSLYENIDILLNHPRDKDGRETLMQYAEADTICKVGRIISAYEKDGGVWGIAEVKADTFEIIKNYLNSTSPAIKSYVIIKGALKTEKPLIIEHLALVTDGHWDILGRDSIKLNKGAIMQEAIKENEKIDSTQSQAEPSAEVKADTENKETQADSADVVAEVEKIAESKDSEILEKILPLLEKINEKLSNGAKLALVSQENESETEKGAESVDSTQSKQDSAEAEAEVEAKSVPEIDEGEITDEAETQDDIEREKLIDSFRRVVDSDTTQKLKMPYIKGRKKLSATYSAILNANSAFVDSKYADVLLQSISAPSKNVGILADAYKGMLANIQKSQKTLNASAEAKGWQATSEAGISVDKSF